MTTILCVATALALLLAALYATGVRHRRQRTRRARAIIAALTENEPGIAGLLLADAARLHTRITTSLRERP